MPLIGWMSVVSRGTTNQMHYPVVGSDTSSAMRARSSDDISRGNQWWRRKFKFWLFSYVPEEPLLSWGKIPSAGQGERKLWEREWCSIMKLKPGGWYVAISGECSMKSRRYTEPKSNSPWKDRIRQNIKWTELQAPTEYQSIGHLH